VASTIQNVARELQSVFSGAADLLARQTGFVQRQSKFSGSRFLQTLTFGWLHNPHATLEELAQTAGSVGVSISPQGVDQRFGPKAALFLERALHDAMLRAISAEPVAIPLLQRFAGVCLLDSTLLGLPAVFAGAWPGSGLKAEDEPAGIKAQVRLNILDGALSGPFLHPACTADQKGALQAAPLPPGALRLADLGFFSLDNLAEMDRQGVYWLTRVQVATGLVDATGRVWTLADFLRGQTGDQVDVPMALGIHHRLPCRVLAMRVPAAVVAKRRQRLRKRSRSRGKRSNFHPDRWALTEWNFYVTNIPVDKLSVQEAWVLARCRWQIELLFKLWKSEGHVDESRSGKPWRILCEVYAKLLGMVVEHWILLVSCWSHPNRSLLKASRTVRMYALSLAMVLSYEHLVCEILKNVRRCLLTGCRVNRRGRAPPTHQLLCDLPKTG
jgi:DDE family transposase